MVINTLNNIAKYAVVTNDVVSSYRKNYLVFPTCWVELALKFLKHNTYYTDFGIK